MPRDNVDGPIFFLTLIFTLMVANIIAVYSEFAGTYTVKSLMVANMVGALLLIVVGVVLLSHGHAVEAMLPMLNAAGLIVCGIFINKYQAKNNVLYNYAEKDKTVVLAVAVSVLGFDLLLSLLAVTRANMS